MKPYTLIGVDSNVFNIIAYTVNAMMAADMPKDRIKEFKTTFMSKSYNEILCEANEIVEECNTILGLEETDDDYDEDEDYV